VVKPERLNNGTSTPKSRATRVSHLAAKLDFLNFLFSKWICRVFLRMKSAAKSVSSEVSGGLKAATSYATEEMRKNRSALNEHELELRYSCLQLEMSHHLSLRYLQCK
jgi:hypothetical protein